MRIIIKIGSNSLISSKKGINENNIKKLVSIVSELKNNNHEVLLVTSGAVALGMNKLSLDKKPTSISLKQACAAIGQVSLMEAYEKHFESLNIHVAQILLSHDDFERRNRMINLSNTIEALFDSNVVPIVNENDALAIEEIKVGDNDTLSAQIVPMIGAEMLILVSDIDGLYNKNPKEYKDAYLIKEVNEINEDIYKMAGTKITSYGTGGMKTKLNAAIIANSAGADMYIIDVKNLDNIISCVNGTFYGTLFKANDKKIPSRIHWLIYKTYAKGSVVVDDGAKNAIINHKSLLSMGIKNVKGEFFNDNIVMVEDLNGNIIAKGITNYSSEDIKKISGHKIKEIKNILGYINKDEVIHADDMIILEGENYGNIR